MKNKRNILIDNNNNNKTDPYRKLSASDDKESWGPIVLDDPAPSTLSFEQGGHVEREFKKCGKTENYLPHEENENLYRIRMIRC